MRIGLSLVLIAIGAILKFAVATDQTHGVSVATIGVILMVVGLAGLIISIALMTTRRRTDIRYRRDGATYVAQGPVDPVDPRY